MNTPHRERKTLAITHRNFASAFIIVAHAAVISQLQHAKRFRTYGGLAFFMTRKTLTKNLKMLFAAHHFVFNSQEIADIAAVINLAPKRVEKLMQSDEWIETVAYWKGNPRTKEGDLGLAEHVWAEIIANCEDLSVFEYPDKPFKCAPTGDPAVYSILNSHLFCVDNLSDSDMRQRLSKDDGSHMRYDGQHMLGYHWFAYPNEAEGLYSKVFARVNVVGNLVVGRGEDTSLVCIKHGRLSLTRQVCDDVVSIHDQRLLVCL